jgi:hypothetical protein
LFSVRNLTKKLAASHISMRASHFKSSSRRQRHEFNHLSGGPRGRRHGDPLFPWLALISSNLSPHRRTFIMAAPSPQLIIPERAAEIGVSRYVDWGAIVAGAAVAVGTFSVFAAFGSAIGLALVPSAGSDRVAATGLLVAAALWALWVQLSSYMAGGYITGRLRQRIGDAKPHEVEMRDGAHGLVMWAVGVALSSLIAGWIAMAGGSAATAAAGTDTQYFAERLMRPQTQAAQSAPASVFSESAVSQTTALLTRMITVSNDADQAFLIREVSSKAGVPEAEAKTRVEQTLAEMKTAADKARRFGVLLAFFTAVSLLLSAVSAWWAAVKGGEHRDQGIDHGHLTRFR